MSSSTIENVVIGLLRQCYYRPKCHTIRQVPSSRLHELPSYLISSARPLSAYSTSANRLQSSYGGNRHIGGSRAFHASAIRAANGNGQPQERIAVLGGGITGLAAAHYLAREKPNASITLIEGSDRLGGWLRSTPIDVGDGQVVFESGPRTLRAGSISALGTLDLVPKT
jgi:oxygen-dependent protoporphyrinogen oxidase